MSKHFLEVLTPANSQIGSCAQRTSRPHGALSAIVHRTRHPSDALSSRACVSHPEESGSMKNRRARHPSPASGAA